MVGWRGVEEDVGGRRAGIGDWELGIRAMQRTGCHDRNPAFQSRIPNPKSRPDELRRRTRLRPPRPALARDQPAAGIADREPRPPRPGRAWRAGAAEARAARGAAATATHPLRRG